MQLAAFFKISAAYFLDDGGTAQGIDAELALLAAVRRTGVQDFAARAAGLFPDTLHAIGVMIDRARELEGLARGAADRRRPVRPCSEPE